MNLKLSSSRNINGGSKENWRQVVPDQKEVEESLGSFFAKAKPGLKNVSPS